MELVTLVKEQHFAGGNGSLRVCAQCFHQLGQPLGFWLGVVVEQHHHAPARRIHGGIAGAHKTHIVPIDQHAHGRVVLLHPGHRIIGAGVVGQDNL